MKLGQGLGLHKSAKIPFGTPAQISGLQLWLGSDYGVNAKTSADFNGSTNYLSSASVDFDKTNTDFSFGCWVKLDSTSGLKGIVSKYNTTGNQRSYMLYHNGTALTVAYSNNGSVASTLTHSTALSTGTWYFVVVVFDITNSLAKISLDSGAFETNAMTTLATSTEDYQIGGYASANVIDGQIDGAFFTDEALSIGTIGNLYNGGSGVDYATASSEFTALVDYWELNELSGNRSGELGHTLTDNNTVGSALGKIVEPVTNGDAVFQWLDKSGNSNHVTQSTFASQPTFSSNGVGTKSKPYLNFDGIDDYLDLTSAIDTTSDLTIFAVVQQDGADSVVLGNNNDNYFWLTNATSLFTSNRLGYEQYTSGETTSLILASATIGTAEDTITMYEDSVSQTTSWVNAVDSLFDMLYVGKHKLVTHNGKIAEILVFNKILSMSELSNVHSYINNKYGIY
jgi:hypothetical protein